MWSREKPPPQIVRKDNVSAIITFEDGQIQVCTSYGRMVAAKISYDPMASVPCAVRHGEWKEDCFWLISWSFLFFIPLLFRLITRKKNYELFCWNELVVQDHNQLREFSLVGKREDVHPKWWYDGCMWGG